MYNCVEYTQQLKSIIANYTWYIYFLCSMLTNKMLLWWYMYNVHYVVSLFCWVLKYVLINFRLKEPDGINTVGRNHRRCDRCRDHVYGDCHGDDLYSPPKVMINGTNLVTWTTNSCPCICRHANIQFCSLVLYNFIDASLLNPGILL